MHGGHPAFRACDLDRLRCGSCWFDLAEESRSAEQSCLLHTLFAFAPLYRGLFQLWMQHFIESSETAWRDDSQPMALVRSLLTDFHIDWDKRCRALQQPFDRSSRGTEPKDRYRPWSTGFDKVDAPLIDGNVAEVLKAALAIVVGSAPGNDDYLRKTQLINFGNTVMLGSIVYLRQAQLTSDSRPNLAALENKFLLERYSHAAYQFLELRGDAKLAAVCPEFAEQRGSDRCYVRTAHGISISLRRECNNMIARLATAGTHDKSDAHRDELLRFQLAEQRLCALLQNCDRLCRLQPAPRSQVDFVLPSHLVVGPTDYSLTYDMKARQPTLERIENDVVQQSHLTTCIDISEQEEEEESAPVQPPPKKRLTASMVPPPVIDEKTFAELFAEPVTPSKKAPSDDALRSPRAVDMVRLRDSSLGPE